MTPVAVVNTANARVVAEVHYMPHDEIEVVTDGRSTRQLWFWTPEWQEMEREADEDIAAGRVARFDSFDEFAADLLGED